MTKRPLGIEAIVTLVAVAVVGFLGSVCFWCLTRLGLDMPDTITKRNPSSNRDYSSVNAQYSQVRTQ